MLAEGVFLDNQSRMAHQTRRLIQWGSACLILAVTVTAGSSLLSAREGDPVSFSSSRSSDPDPPPPPPQTQPRLQRSFENGVLTLSWKGPAVLQEAESVIGPWTDVPGAGSGLKVSLTAPAKFYRLRQ